uniref:G-protein coupled receptors family 1 profile domain-containing protein n=3 Tax=Wuchereria bancrofti TaxID=6293 RepID=A0AAF5PUR9_WUCBA
MNVTEALDNNSTANLENAGTDLYLFILPVIVIFGLCGNVISLVTIFYSRLREISANLYLIVLTTSDSVFLLGLLLILFKLDFITYHFCVIIEYILSTSSYISSWSVAALTIERYLAIAYPLKHARYGHLDRWKMILFWIPVPFAFNLIQFISLIPYDDKSDPQYPNIRKCIPYDGSSQIVIEATDVILCYVMPCFCVVLLNLLVAGKVKRGFTCDSNRSRFHSSSIRRRQSSAMILLVVPIVYISLNTPFYLLRIMDTIALYVFQSNEFSIIGGLDGTLTIFLYNTAHYLYYINFACDVIVYAFSSSNFRKTAVIAWRQIVFSHSGKIQKATSSERYRNVSCRLSKLTGE